MHGPHESFGAQISEQGIIFNAENRADKISIILFGDYVNEVLPLTPFFLAGRKEGAAIPSPIKSFLEFYGVGGPNAWVLADVGGDLQAGDLISHPYENLIRETDTLITVLNAYLQRSSPEEASQIASQILQLLRSQTPRYSIKHNS